MPIDKRLGSKIPGYTDPDKMHGAKRDSGPYIGIVKNNADPARAGRLQVFIPDFGGIELEQSHWITVGYANPYMGAARTSTIINERSSDNSFTKTNHSYGMWFTPPDIGNYVLITFVAGDTNNGYWFACVNPDLSHWAIPAIAGAENIETPLDSTLAKALTTPPYPVVEFNEENEGLQSQYSNFLQINKPVHDDQVKALLRQGLEDDKVRGVISSSSQRESPSRVFGISTPGIDGPVQDPYTGQTTYRKGGHSFVMDDGDSSGIDNLIRLRTAGGHQILMNDSEDVLYIGNKAGTVWMEFTGEGKTNLYSESDISVRSKKNINFHADADINFCAKNNINMYAGSTLTEQSSNININATSNLKAFGGTVGIGSGSTLNMSAATEGSFLAGTDLVFFGSMLYMNTQTPTSVSAPPNIPMVSHAETVPTMSAPYFKWKANASLESTIPKSSPVPTHEPFISHPAGPGKGRMTTTPGSSSPQEEVYVPSAPGSPQPGPISAKTKGLGSKKLAVQDLAKQPLNANGVGALTAAETTALKAQLARSESNFNYSAINTIGYVGKYQFGYLALIDRGYVTPNTKRNSELSDPSHWTGKNGINSLDAFFSATAVQEAIMDDNLQANYNILTRLGTINSSSTSDDISGKLAVCHLLGAGGCNSWANGKGGADQYGTDGDTYYNLGKYAVVVMAGQVSNSNIA